MISLIPTWLKVLFLVIAVAAYTSYIHRSATIKERNSWIAKLAESEHAARDKERELQSKIDDGAKHYEQLKSQALLSSNAARAANNKLRDAIDQFQRTSTETTRSADVERLANVFRECTERYTTVAGKLDSVILDKTALQDYAMSVSK